MAASRRRGCSRPNSAALGAFTGRASALASLPARAHFAWTYGRDLRAYDEIVGVHFLGETYPGLNSFQPSTEDRRTIAQIGRPLRRGIVPGADGTFAIPSGRARLFVPLNRTGGVRIAVSLAHPAGGEVVLRWNVTEVVRAKVPRTPEPVELVSHRLERGVNLLDLRVPPGTQIVGLDLFALPR